MHAEQLLPLPTASLTSEVKDHALVSFLGFGLEAAETVCLGIQGVLSGFPLRCRYLFIRQGMVGAGPTRGKLYIVTPI